MSGLVDAFMERKIVESGRHVNHMVLFTGLLWFRYYGALTNKSKVICDADEAVLVCLK